MLPSCHNNWPVLSHLRVCVTLLYYWDPGYHGRIRRATYEDVWQPFPFVYRSSDCISCVRTYDDFRAWFVQLFWCERLSLFCKCCIAGDVCLSVGMRHMRV